MNPIKPPLRRIVVKVLSRPDLCSGKFCLEFPNSFLNTNHKLTVEGPDDSIL
jgi:hypothetical protein